MATSMSVAAPAADAEVVLRVRDLAVQFRGDDGSAIDRR